ncbi:MAG: hypothetical protein IJM98_02605 [Oscillospiraceae bacterium]|nr:hypothetical protein [Oscillospiraceae bacterium]
MDFSPQGEKDGRGITGNPEGIKEVTVESGKLMFSIYRRAEVPQGYFFVLCPQGTCSRRFFRTAIQGRPTTFPLNAQVIYKIFSVGSAKAAQYLMHLCTENIKMKKALLKRSAFFW